METSPSFSSTMPQLRFAQDRGFTQFMLRRSWMRRGGICSRRQHAEVLVRRT